MGRLSSEESALREIAVEAQEGQELSAVADAWVRQLCLGDGVRVAVYRAGEQSRPRRFVVHQGTVISPQRYAAIAIMDALEEVLRHEDRPLDPWEILLAARHQNSPVARASRVSVASSARLLQRSGRLRPGPRSGTWMLARRDGAAA